MSINFTNRMPEWKNSGTEPSTELKNSGFTGGYKPPASVFNWFWHGIIAAVTELQTKLASHTHTKSEVGLSNVDNTSDLNKPISTAVWTALNGKSSTSHVHNYAGSSSAGGAATSAEKLQSTIKFSVTGGASGSVNTNFAGDVSLEINSLDPAKLSAAVPVNKGGTNATTAAQARTNLGLGNVNNTSDADKPISTAVSAALNGKSDTGHTHNYAGSLSAGGAANSALKLQNSIKFSVSGGATGSVSGIDGSANVSVSITGLNPDYLSKATPITKGGTGATTAANARTNLGLGSSSTLDTENVVSTLSTKIPTSAAVSTAINTLKSQTKSRTSVIIASYDTKNPLKDKADYTCTSADFPTVFTTALNAVANGGEIQLLDGTYNADFANVINVNKAVKIHGCGRQTVLKQAVDPTDDAYSNPIFRITSDNVEISDMMICDVDCYDPIEMIQITKNGAIFRNIFFITYAQYEDDYASCIKGEGDCRFTRIQDCRVFKGTANTGKIMFRFNECTNFSGVIGGNISSGYDSISVAFASETHKNQTAIYGHTNIRTPIEQ